MTPPFWPKRKWFSPPWSLENESTPMPFIRISGTGRITFEALVGLEGADITKIAGTMRLLCASPLVYEAARKAVKEYETQGDNLAAAMNALKLCLDVSHGAPE